MGRIQSGYRKLTYNALDRKRENDSESQLNQSSQEEIQKLEDIKVPELQAEMVH